jgi:hypothetical protein
MPHSIYDRTFCNPLSVRRPLGRQVYNGTLRTPPNVCHGSRSPRTSRPRRWAAGAHAPGGVPLSMTVPHHDRDGRRRGPVPARGGPSSRRASRRCAGAVHRVWAGGHQAGEPGVRTARGAPVFGHTGPPRADSRTAVSPGYYGRGSSPSGARSANARQCLYCCSPPQSSPRSRAPDG